MTKKTISGVMSLFILSLCCHACAKSRKKENTDSTGSAECRRDTEIRSSCFTSVDIINQNVGRISKLDLLFVVDNSGSMVEEQAKLRDQLSRMIKVLTTGDKTPNDGVENRDFSPVEDLHLAVVSADMGLPGLAPEENPISTGACLGTGDDGNFLYDPSAAIAAGLDCPGGGDYPIFLEQINDDLEDLSTSLQRAEQTAESFACMSTLGTSGCGFQMPLEAALKALWPAQKANLTEEQRGLDISFLAGSQGHGDAEHRAFLRGTPYHPTEADKLSLLVITVVTDTDDCSAGAQGDLQFLSLDFPVNRRIDLGTRCYQDTVENWGNKYPVGRYIDGFKALRPDFPDLVMFSAIVGIPADIVEDENGDYSSLQKASGAFYDQILNHPDMQETPNPETNNLSFSCIHQDPDTGETDTRAFPARRIVEVAKDFGNNGNVISICSDDFTPWMDPIIDIVGSKIGGICLPRAYTRDSKGMVGRDIVWTMPAGYDCTGFEFLSALEDGRPRFDETGRSRCVVDQIPVINPNATDPAEALDLNYKTGLGWYYDDFSADMHKTCKINDRVISITKQQQDDPRCCKKVGRSQPPDGLQPVTATNGRRDDDVGDLVSYGIGPGHDETEGDERSADCLYDTVDPQQPFGSAIPEAIQAIRPTIADLIARPFSSSQSDPRPRNRQK